MRGFYGEGTEALGDFFQISNQVALGHSELEILSNLEGVINKIITREETLREELLDKKKEVVSDRICRSYGTLKSAKIITFAETIKLLSAVRLGVDMGIIKDIDLNTINEILLLTQPAHLQKLLGQEGEAFERDIKRADLIKKKLETEDQ
jgi:protein arginine kinase